MGFFEQAWAIEVVRWAFFVQYWYVFATIAAIGIFFIILGSK